MFVSRTQWERKEGKGEKKEKGPGSFYCSVCLCADPQRDWPPTVCHLLEMAPLRYSPAARLELHYLFEIGRIKATLEDLLTEISPLLGLSECRQPFAAVVENATNLTWTRDVFDRLIVGQALAAGARLISRDPLIREHFADAVWAE